MVAVMPIFLVLVIFLLELNVSRRPVGAVPKKLFRVTCGER